MGMTFCFKVRKNKPETCEIIPADLADNAMGKTQVFEWFYRSKVRKLWLNKASFQIVSPQVEQWKMRRKI
jgi:hypothetical protein